MRRSAIPRRRWQHSSADPHASAVRMGRSVRRMQRQQPSLSSGEENGDGLDSSAVPPSPSATECQLILTQNFFRLLLSVMSSPVNATEKLRRELHYVGPQRLEKKKKSELQKLKSFTAVHSDDESALVEIQGGMESFAVSRSKKKRSTSSKKKVDSNQPTRLN